jgi:hypothetical protein
MAYKSKKRGIMELPKPTTYLAEWFVRYTKNRDLLFKKISDIKEEGNKIIITQKDGTVTHYYVEPFPEDMEKLAAMPESQKGIVLYNSKDNFDRLIKSWKKLSETKGLTIYFVNPFSKLDKRWIINPYVHSQISDKQSLETGLSSMYILVDPITKQEVEQLTK